jgi:hypothetical protein
MQTLPQLIGPLPDPTPKHIIVQKICRSTEGLTGFVNCLQNYHSLLYGLEYEVVWNILSDVMMLRVVTRNMEPVKFKN